MRHVHTTQSVSPALTANWRKNIESELVEETGLALQTKQQLEGCDITLSEGSPFSCVNYSVDGLIVSRPGN